MAKDERSAGILLFRRAGSPDGERLFLLLDYGRYWDYPKGHVEAGEDDPAAARRELAEETGITDFAWVEGFRQDIVYYFRSRRGLIRKTVVFFLAETSVSQVTISHEHVGYAWVSGEAALGQLAYASAKQVLSAAMEFLQSRK